MTATRNMPGHPAAAWAALVAVVLFGGCRAGEPRPWTTSARWEASLRPDPDRLWDSACEVLRRHRFRLDRLDRRAGVITTWPVTSQSVWEFWRHDVATTEDLWESTINPIRRWVEVFFEPDERGQWSALRVVVHKQRFSAPDRQFNSTGSVYAYFGYSLPTTTGELRVSPEDERWEDMGEDEALAAHLLRKILGEAGRCGAGPAPGKTTITS